MSLSCSCGARFTSLYAEARHRHNFPLLCQRRRKAPKKSKAMVFYNETATIPEAAFEAVGAITKKGGAT